MKKLIALFVSFVLVLSLVACASNSVKVGADGDSDIKIGIVLIGDENEGYSYSHIEGLKDAAEELDIPDSSIIFKYNIGESEDAYDACVDLAEQGCNLIICNSYGHQSYCLQAASEYPELEFVSMTGDLAKSSGLPNLHNAFTKIYQARYIGGVVAGMKVQELINAGKLVDKNYDEDGNIKLGYVGAYPYAEVVSGYTAFFLGARSIVPNLTMQVQYTNSWGDMNAEYESATALVNNGCVVISQHADTIGAPTAIEGLLKAGNQCYSVGYNIDMQAAAPNAALTSPANNWKNYYKLILDATKKGEKFPNNWAEGFESDSVKYTVITANCAEGTKEKVKEVEEKIRNGELEVFDTNTFTVDGKKVDHAFATDTDGDFVNDADEAVFDGYYHESYFQSAPSFSLRIDGIKELLN